MNLTQHTPYFTRISIPFAFSVLLSILWPKLSLADTRDLATSLEVTPTRCVALRQGQVCYQEVEFVWQAQSKADYCLVNLSTNEQIRCWQYAQKGIFSMDFQSTQSTDFVLRAQDQAIDLSKVRITVSWVFKSSKRPKSSWKLF